jgi:biotin synthase
MLKQVQHDDLRTDWTRTEIAALFDLPFTELLFQAANVHRDPHGITPSPSQ